MCRRFTNGYSNGKARNDSIKLSIGLDYGHAWLLPAVDIFGKVRMGNSTRRSRIKTCLHFAGCFDLTCGFRICIAGRFAFILAGREHRIRRNFSDSRFGQQAQARARPDFVETLVRDIVRNCLHVCSVVVAYNCIPNANAGTAFANVVMRKWMLWASSMCLSSWRSPRRSVSRCQKTSDLPARFGHDVGVSILLLRRQ